MPGKVTSNRAAYSKANWRSRKARSQARPEGLIRNGACRQPSRGWATKRAAALAQLLRMRAIFRIIDGDKVAARLG